MKAKAKAALLLVPVLLAGVLIPASAGKAAGRFNLSYLFSGTPETFVRDVDQAKGSLQTVAPAYLELTQEGTVQAAPDMGSSFIRDMHDRGIRVVPYLNNEWNRTLAVKTVNNRAQVTDQLAELVKTYNLDGIQLDLENLPASSRESYTDMVRLLRGKLPTGKEVSVAVGANPTGTSSGWLGAFDYKALAPYCDYLLIMAYEEHFEGDPVPGPVSGLPFTESSLQFALSQLPPEKVVLGIAFYGRLWKDDGTLLGVGVPDRLVDTLVRRYNGKVEVDRTSGSAVGTFTIGPADTGITISGHRLTPGNYTVWFENESTLKTRLALADRYNLLGTGSWSLNQESAGTWDYYSLWLNGAAFGDAEGHWAQNEIASTVHKGWLNGMEPGLFSPDGPLTRAQAAAVLRRVGNGLSPSADASTLFRDVPQNHWAGADIVWAYTEGVIDGTAPGLYEPEAPLTREQLAAMLARWYSLPSKGTASFSDVSPGRWSANSIAAVQENGLVNGFEDGTFRPAEPLTRAQMAAVLDRLSKLA
ncbi:S-layer homology domain-containing protein [Paenibacillus aurantius]|uniref:S-layer homology domain-containing protein n=1 Tax=Paenibacillus aurantius TaxID=2918900 RepID=A0AA96LKR4_9BACL|nr:S-layer homology domain-containing protein [Paenibacillus aurantius]WNQ13876.1 S-layer homology domain-containing protein [Paenibacillus aurantius]